jgi:hypothetical protein
MLDGVERSPPDVERGERQLEHKAAGRTQVRSQPLARELNDRPDEPRPALVMLDDDTYS